MASTSPPPRLFKPEQVENMSTKKVRKFAPEPVETTSKSSRKFVPQPIESTTRHIGEAKDHKIEGPETQDTPYTNTSDSKSKRRFAPQPVETTSRQSRVEEPRKGQGAFASAQHGNSTLETAITRRARFAPEPVEVSSRSSRRRDIESTGKAGVDASPVNGTPNASNDIPKPARRRFAPEPVETSSKSSRNYQFSQNQSPDSSSDGEKAPMLSHEMELGPPPSKEEPPKRRFVPQPIESSSRSSRTTTQSASSSIDDNDAAPLFAHEGALGPPTPPKPARRRFAPQLMETAKRSRKSGDDSPAVLQNDKTNASPHEDTPPGLSTAKPRPHVHISAPDHSDEGSPGRLPRSQELAQHRQNIRARSRQHSFKVPSLPDIDSSESEESRSNSRSQSHYGDSDTSDEISKNATRMRESLDGSYSSYLLALAAQAADKQLRDQAAAAFPNSDIHEPVAHYVDRSDSDEDISDPPIMRNGRPDPTRRDSGDEKWALKEMQQHAEGLGQHERGRRKSVIHRVDRRASKRDLWTSSPAGGPFANTEGKPKKMIGGHQRDTDLKQMRKAASPPMLGSEIEFPRCSSPENARFDVTQGADFLRKQMCYLTAQTTEDKTGLWARANGKSTNEVMVQAAPRISGGTWGSKVQSGTQSPAKGVGLWGGFCTGQDAKPEALPSGLQTPLRTPSHTPGLERDDPFNALSIVQSNSNAPALPSGRAKAPLASGQSTPRLGGSPPHHANKLKFQQQQFAAAIDERFALEAKIDAEFNDAFVTQVYNYLSLGYPSLARKFDEELSRISRVPMEELRADDKVGAQTRGHVKVPGWNESDWAEHDWEREKRMSDDVKHCRRWKALRRYVKEWARQIGKREKEAEARGINVLDTSRAWGMPVRKGSWGI